MQKEFVDRTLEEMENEYWQEGQFATGLIEKCYFARKKKIRDLDPIDLRLLISQNISLPIVIPLAMKHLLDDILLETLYYPGDFLQSVLRVPLSFWKNNKPLLKQFDAMLDGIGDKIIQSEDITQEIKNSLIGDYIIFKKRVNEIN